MEVMLVGIGIVAFGTTVITELVKGCGPIDKIPTKLLALVTALIVALGYSCMTVAAFSLSAVISTVALGFLGAFVAIFGWDIIAEIWERFAKAEEDK